MAQYIDKAALVTKIERRIAEMNPDIVEDWRYRLQREHDIEVIKNILSLINTLEVKEVDLEKEISEYFVSHPDEFFSDKYKLIAKHFFELGLKAQKGE